MSKLRMPWGKYHNKQINKLPLSYLKAVVRDIDEEKAVKLLGKQRYNLIKRIIDEANQGANPRRRRKRRTKQDRSE